MTALHYKHILLDISLTTKLLNIKLLKMSFTFRNFTFDTCNFPVGINEVLSIYLQTKASFDRRYFYTMVFWNTGLFPCYFRSNFNRQKVCALILFSVSFCSQLWKIKSWQWTEKRRRPSLSLTDWQIQRSTDWKTERRPRHIGVLWPSTFPLCAIHKLFIYPLSVFT